ncbi:hypothetical protein [Pseudomonas frederiksbergensis]|uniref:Uncharacterized protein n=1 Tax=Pseudomonas frederiksbergensis TaxID=104087 RepID=A0A423KQI8_9PSED|nr:hypothetical protein [Pseudomonas frederiksbergensis]RON57411.1 hypothetical protein BK665_04715 [Pseudomonas frederiksbergensis]
MALKLPSIEFRGRKLDSYISFLILFTGLFLSVAMPLLMHRDPGPDAMTLWSSYARADNCNFWNPFSPDRSSYECSAYLLRPTGINLTNAWAYGMACNLFLTAVPVLMFRRMPLTIFFTLCLWGVVRSFFLENLTKEIIVSVAMISILLFSFSRRYRGGFFCSAVIYGVLIRPYWILFSLAWFGVCVMKKYVSRMTFFLMLFLFYLAIATAIQLVVGYSVSSIRASNNELRTAGEEGSKSLIVSWISGGDFVSQALDSMSIFFRLSFPVELILLSGLGQIIFVVLMMMTSLLMFRMITSSDYKGVRIDTKVKELIAIPLSFLLVQGLFEPDFGSFARHFSMVVPVLFMGLGLQLRAKKPVLVESRILS